MKSGSKLRTRCITSNVPVLALCLNLLHNPAARAQDGQEVRDPEGGVNPSAPARPSAPSEQEASPPHQDATPGESERPNESEPPAASEQPDGPKPVADSKPTDESKQPNESERNQAKHSTTDEASPTAEASASPAGTTPKENDEASLPSPNSDTSEFPESPFYPAEGDPTFVTVDRRKKDVQKVAGSVHAISGGELARRGVTSMRELPATTPYVEVGAREGNIELYIRGIGASDNLEQGDPAIAAHLDGVYIPRQRGAAIRFFDVERVEINLGPQGTLWGRNALGGSLNVVTKAPKPGEWEADASVQLGNYNQRLTRAAVNVPLSDRFALRFALLSERRDPFYENKGGDPLLKAAEDADTWAYRLAARWLPTGNMSVTVRFDDATERGTGSVGSNYTEALRRGVEPSEVPNPRAVAYVGHQPSQSLDHWGISSNIEVDFGSAGLEVISSYRDLTYTQHTGNTNGVFFHGVNDIDLDRYTDSVWRTNSQSQVNEIRLFAADNSRFRWTVGFFHFFENQTIFLGQVEADPSYGWLGQEYNYNDVPSGAVAGFADATADLTHAFRALAGFRLTSEFKERNGIGGGFGLQCNPEALAEAQRDDPDATCLSPSDPSFDNGIRWGTPGFQFKQDRRTDYTAGSDANTLEGVADRVDTFIDGIESWGSRDEVERFLAQPGADVGTGFVEQHGSVRHLFPDFRLGVEWDVTPLSLLYLTFTTGHKSGGLNDNVYVPGDANSYVAPFGPESLYSTELGSKNLLLDKRLVLNGAAFWYAYSNYQTSNVQAFGAAKIERTVRGNDADARVLGLQIDAVGYLPRGLTGRASLTLLDARFLNANVVDTRLSRTTSEQPRLSLDGNFLPRAPQVAMSYGIAQVIPTDLGYFDWAVSGQTKSKMYMTQFNGEGYDGDGLQSPLLNDVVPWTTRIDASVGYAKPESDIRFDAFVANLTNIAYMTSFANVPNANLRFFNTPRQYGIRLSVYL